MQRIGFPLFLFLVHLRQMARTGAGVCAEAERQQLDKQCAVWGVRVGVISRLIDGSSARRSLNQHSHDSLACVAPTVSVFISCTHTDAKAQLELLGEK